VQGVALLETCARLQRDGETQPSLRDEEAQPFRHPALKYRATVKAPLRGEEPPFFHRFYPTRKIIQRHPALKYRATVKAPLRGEEPPFFHRFYPTRKIIQCATRH
jgi:hypothetical protein